MMENSNDAGMHRIPLTFQRIRHLFHENHLYHAVGMDRNEIVHLFLDLGICHDNGIEEHLYVWPSPVSIKDDEIYMHIYIIEIS